MSYTEYVKQTWDTTSYVNPTRMNHIESGIKSNSDGITSLNNDLATNPLKTEYVSFSGDVLSQALSQTKSLVVGLTASTTTNLPTTENMWKYAYVTVKRRSASQIWVEIDAETTGMKAVNFYNGSTWKGWQIFSFNSDLAYISTQINTQYGNLLFQKWGKIVTVQNVGDLHDIPNGSFTFSSIPSGYSPRTDFNVDAKRPASSFEMRFQFTANAITCYNYGGVASGTVNTTLHATYITA